jgi:ribosomal protein L16
MRIVQMRMGKGKGSFDHWAARVAVNQILFEVKGMLHEQVVRDAFRLAGNKLPGKSRLLMHAATCLIGVDANGAII